MRGKTRVFAALTALAVVGLVAYLAPASSAGSNKSGATVVHVIEHATTDFVIDTDGDGADSTGDLLTWHNQLYDESDQTVVGHDQGFCTRVDPAEGTWECVWTNFLDGGKIMVEGPFFDTKDSSIAVIGGTGTYAHATGSMKLVSIDGGAEYDFIFKLDL
jgi:hypothetical protein